MACYIAGGHPNWYFPSVWFKGSFYGAIWPYALFMRFQKKPNTIFYDGKNDYYKIINEKHYQNHPMPVIFIEPEKNNK
jgi:hypothetical protein